VLFIMFCVRLVIDNAFEISAKERIRQFGLLKAVGASKKQILQLTLWEAFYLAVPGVILGILLGTGCAAGIFAAIKDAPFLKTIADSYNTANMLVFELRPYVFITSAVIGVLWVCVSAVATGMRSIKASPVDAMRGADRYEKISVTRKPSGVEKGKSFISAYSSLSVKRNRKRYIITMLSMILSITLFASFSYGLDIYSDKLEREYNEIRAPYDFSISCQSLSRYYAANSAYEMRHEQCFENVQFDSSVVIYGSADDFGISESYREEGMGYLIAIHPVNENTFNKHIKPLSDITYEELFNSGKILLCADAGDKKAFDNAPEKISGQMFMVNDGVLGENLTAETAGLYTTENRLYTSDAFLVAVMAEEAYVAFTDKTGGDSYAATYAAEDGTEYTICYGSIYADAVPGEEKTAEGYLDRHFYGSFENNLSAASESRSLLEIIRLGGYFVIGIISLIAAVNIVNIISANVINRTSELAMLRACGMSDKQLHLLILREGFIYAAAAGIISAVLTAGSVLLIKLPFMTHFNDLYLEDIGLELSPAGPLIYVLAAMPAAFLIAAAASFLPARRIINSPIVSNIRNREQV
ncbi:MAG: ABC transporter permease, partial [Huintestinicola sp.]